ncbi:MAG: hydroxymethylglutaryl-CoA synthase [Saprospiraceae bacterium]|nr:hydroxymethylglutaryl-CoA synthase [Saprospiraceae bacterium]
MEKYSTKVGIDDIAAYIPNLYLPIEALAEARSIEYAKLHKGLGLKAMAMPDVDEDAATMAANAALELMRRNKLDPRSIGRLYVGTESGLDGSKPIASYVVGMLTQYFENQYGKDCLSQCDAVDLTFACIGAVDALQNTLDWAKGAPNRVGIVIATDFAKYELGSGGEYTQGAGAIAMLVKQNPGLLAIGDAWGVATTDVHDFFKPVRQIKREDAINEALQLSNLGFVNNFPEGQIQSNPALGAFDSTDAYLHLHRDTPIFDGQYSNDCYQERIKQAYQRFITEALGYVNGHAGPAFSGRWARLVFHLPYAYHARRIFTEIYLEEAIKLGKKAQIEEETGTPIPVDKNDANYLKLVSKTLGYQVFVQERIEKGERASSLVGNVYTGSIFLSLMSLLEADYQEGQDLSGKKLGFFAYGSGSKSKVFEGEIQPQWREMVSRFNLPHQLENRQMLDYEIYEALHRGKLNNPIGITSGVFKLANISDDLQLPGVRTYKYVEAMANSEV